MKKFLIVMLLITMILSSFVACADPNATNEKNPGTEGKEPEDPGETEDPGDKRVWYDQLPEKNFNDDSVVFAYFGTEDGSKEACSVLIREDDGDSVNSKMFDRNNQVMERFHIQLEGHHVADGYLSQTIIPVLASGSDDYDVLVGYQYFDVALAASGYLANLSQYSDILRLEDASYWAGDYTKNINYKDHIYWTTGDITLNYIGNICCGFVNSALYKTYAEKEFGSIYEVVKNKEWTLENMSMMAENAYWDSNANDKPDDGDQFGYQISWGVEMAYAAGINTSMRDENGDISITINDDRTIDVMQLLNEISKADYTTSNDTEDGQIKNFVEERVMIYCRCLATTETPAFRSMETDYYIVPLPMGDESMEDYRSATATGTNIVGISNSSSKPETAAFVMEALCAESARTVIPTYYEGALKGRYTRDKESKEMIELVHNTVGVDFVNTWSFNYFDSYQFYLTFDASTVASRIKANEVKWQTALDGLLDTLSELD